jgi:tagatose 1,6-diphosphate aldolase GatY/KbaY
MLVSSVELLHSAREGGYALGAFNIYNLEGVQAVVKAAEAEQSPAMLQLHPAALRYGGTPLVTLCLSAAREAAVPIAVHLDHSSSAADIRNALEAGLGSIMADGSMLPYADNVRFTAEMAALAHAKGAGVEAELGRLTGTEDDVTVEETEARYTDPEQAAEFVRQTAVDALAVCIGNVHGQYRGVPKLDFQRLEAIAGRVAVPLVLHGASGLPNEMVRRSIELGVCKFNVNTEVRDAYVRALRQAFGAPGPTELLPLMTQAVDAMQSVVSAKLQLFGSQGRVGRRP